MPKTKEIGPSVGVGSPALGPANHVETPTADVLTLAEVAAYLRVSEAEVLSSIQREGLPGRQLGTSWRFLKAALQEWLRNPPPVPAGNDFWARHFGALREDASLEGMLQEIERRRGHVPTESPS